MNKRKKPSETRKERLFILRHNEKHRHSALPMGDIRSKNTSFNSIQIDRPATGLSNHIHMDHF